MDHRMSLRVSHPVGLELIKVWTGCQLASSVRWAVAMEMSGEEQGLLVRPLVGSS